MIFHDLEAFINKLINNIFVRNFIFLIPGVSAVIAR